MEYRIVEEYYGPQIRFNDWKADRAELVWAGGTLQISTDNTATVRRTDYPKRGGGDVETVIAFDFEQLRPDWTLALHFNANPSREGAFGLRIVMRSDALEVLLGDRKIHEESGTPWETGRAYRLKLVTLGRAYSIELDGRELVSGSFEQSIVHNEGFFILAPEKLAMRVLSFAENFIVHDVNFPKWRRTELLYEEPFGQQSFSDNWVCNGEPPECATDAFNFKHMSVNILKEHFDGPIAMDCIARPMHTDEYSAGVTDAIFIWMIDQPGGDIFEFMRKLPNAALSNYLPVPLYWVDFGGSNNVTTRLRKNPNRQMIRQFTDRPRLLQRDRTYGVTCVQLDSIVEFWIDGACWIQAFDPEPLTSGYVGFRAYIADMKIEELKVWRIEKC